MGERRGTKALELWCRRMVEGYPGVKIDNMTTSWRDGLAFCAIIHHFRPELIDFAKLNKDDIYENNNLAFTIAEKHLGIPALLEPEDMVEYEVPDRLSILTYLAQFYRAFSSPQGSSPSRIVPKRPATTTDRGIVSPASTSPPTKMFNRSVVGSQKRDPCSKCGLPVFIAERLNVGKELFHRTCFRCARCNSQLSLANYYETASNQFCCETCPDEEPARKVPEFPLTRSLSDEEKSASLKRKEPDAYSSMFESALENPQDASLKQDSTLTRQFETARSTFLTMQVENALPSSASSDDEMNEELPDLPKTKPPDLKLGEEECKKDSDNKDYESALSVSTNNSSVKQKDNDFKSVVHRMKDSDQLQAANVLDSYRVKSVVTKDILNSSAKTSDRPISVRDRMKLFEENNTKPTKTNTVMPTVDKLNLSPIPSHSLTLEQSKLTPEITKPKVFTSTPQRLFGNTKEMNPSSATQFPASNLNNLLENQILKKSHTTPSLTDLPKTIDANSSKNRQSVEDLTKLHRKFMDEKADVSALDDNLVDVDSIESALTVPSLETDAKPTDLHPVSEKLVEKDNNQILGDGNLGHKEELIITEDSGVIESDDIIEIISISDSIIEVEDTTGTDCSRKSVSQSTQNETEVSDDTKDVIEIFDTTTEDYPEDLNPFGDDQEVHTTPLVGKSLNPFDEDEEDEPSLQPKEEKDLQKPVPQVRRNLLGKEEKEPKSLNPFDEDSDENENAVQTEVPKARRKLIPAVPLQSEEDSPNMIYTKRISVGPDESPLNIKKNIKRVIPAPRISLNPLWSDIDDDDTREVGNDKLPVPKPRKMRHSTEQHTPESKWRDQQLSSTFGSTSSLSSAASGSQSIRKKKPAPRPPILSPEKQESTQSSLTSSPSTSAQHSPRLSASKNRKAKKAPPPPTLTPKSPSTRSEVENTSSELSFIEQQNFNRKDWEKEKDIKDEENRTRQSLIFPSSPEDLDISGQAQNSYIPNKSTYGKWKKKKGPAPSRPIPQKRSITQLPLPEIKKELDLIELQQQGLEKQGVRLEQIIRERCEGPQVEPNDMEPIDVDDLILQLFEVVNEKNELCRRQAELMYLKRQQRLEEEHAEVEYQIRCLMMQPEANKTDSDKTTEEELIARLVEIVERRNEIIECLEIDRVRENDEDSSITNSLNTYAAKRDEVSVPVAPDDGDKKEKKKKKKIKLKLSKKTDLDKDIDESESSSLSSNKEKKKKKFALF